MKLKMLLIIFFLPLFLFSQKVPDGIYHGVQPKYWTLKNGKKIIWKDNERPNHAWYSVIFLKLRGDSIFWDDGAASIYGKDTIYSASDGGFFYYTGTFIRSDTTLAMDLKELFCDYCGIPKEKDATGKWVISIRKKSYSAKIVEDGFVINGYLFKRTTKNYRLRSEDPPPKFWK